MGGGALQRILSPFLVMSVQGLEDGTFISQHEYCSFGILGVCIYVPTVYLISLHVTRGGNGLGASLGRYNNFKTVASPPFMFCPSKMAWEWDWGRELSRIFLLVILSSLAGSR